MQVRGCAVSRDVLVSEQTATGLPALPLLANVRYGVPCEYPVSTRYSTRYSTPLVPLGTVEAARVARSTPVSTSVVPQCPHPCGVPL